MNKIWKRGISLLLVLCTLVGYIVLPDVPAVQAEAEVITTIGPNLFANGTFGEQKTVINYPRNKLPEGWTVGGNTGSMLEGLQVTNEYAHDGAYSIKLYDQSASHAISGHTPITSITPADAGKKFEGSVYMKGSGPITLTVTCYGSDTTFTSATLIKAYSKNIELTEEWTQYKVSNTINEGTESLQFKITTKSASITEVYFDSAWLSIEGADVNLIDNASFETLPNETPTTETIVGDTTGWENVSDMWSVVADGDNNVALKVQDDKTDDGKYVYYGVDVEAGAKYNFKIDYKGSYTAGAPAVLLRQDTHDNQTNLHEFTNISLADTWNTYEGTVEVPAGVTKLFIVLSSDAAATGTAYFDNVSLAKVTTTITDDNEGGDVGGDDNDDNDDNEGGNTGGEVVKPENEIIIPEQNLIRNPFFEMTLYTYVTPINASTVPNGWTLEAIDSDVHLFKSNVSAYDGEWSLQVVDNSTTGGFKLSTKVENIVPGQEYAYMYARMGEGRPGMHIRYYDAAGNLLEEFSNAQGGKETWSTSRKLAVAPENTSYAIVSFETTAIRTCNIYLDGVSFCSTADGANLLPNFSFENYPEDFQDVLLSTKNEVTTKGWTLSGGAANISLVATESDLDKSTVGNYMINFNDQEADRGVSMYYTVDIEAGKTYAFSAMARGQMVSGGAGIRLVFYYDEACQQQANVGKKPYVAMSITCSNDYWSRGVVSAVAPEGTVKARVYLISAGATVGNLYFGNATLVEDIATKFGNLDLEDLDENGAMQKWNSHEDGKLAPSTKDPFAGKYALQIKDNSQAKQQGAISNIVDLSGYQHTGLAVDQLFFTLSGRIKDAKNVKAELSLIYYDNSFKELKRDSVTSNGSGKWQFLRFDSQMPMNAAYAKILVTVGKNASATGTVYLDDLTFVGEYVDQRAEAYDWQIKEDEGNRLYFNDAELEAMRKFAMDDTINALGVSGADAYRTLIKSADGYMKQTSYKMTWDQSPENDRVTSYVVNLVHIQDMSSDPLFADVPGGRNWPYLESLSNVIYTRVSTVAMAYAITGDAKYAEKAIGWALDLCEWEYWCDTKYCWPSNFNGTLDNPRFMRSVAIVYDMCYELLTQAQRDLMCENIIQKGLKPLCFDLDNPGRQFHNKYMSRCVGIIISGAAIINEENKEEVGRYLDKAYAFCTAFADERYATANNEGYQYTKASTDDMLMAMDCARRATGRESLLAHPFFTEVLVDWVVDFLSPDGTNQLPAYSDSGTSGYFKPAMLLMNKTYGNGKAGYFLQQVGLDKDAFNVLCYANYDPVITQPTENDYVVFVERVGYGGLRTGWEDGELMFYIIGNTSDTGHNHYDQLSFQITTGGLWPASDPGYSNLSGGFDEMQAHNIILVDGQWQTIKGTASSKPVVDGQLYGQLTGSAPNAYAEGLLTQWDRHSIMINHNDRPYYIVIDEMASDTERTYDFNFNPGGWTEVTVDGKPMAEGINKGNKVAISGNNGYFFLEYVSKDKMNIEAVSYEDGGPVLQADAGSSKSQQFMTILTKPYGIELDDSYSFLPLLSTPDLVSYKTSSSDPSIIKAVSAQGNAMFFFRGHKEGDWIELPFTAPESGTFDLILRFAKYYNYGIYKIYLDGEYITTFDAYDAVIQVYPLSLGKREITAGEHTLKLELVGANPKTMGTLISVASITFGTERSMPDHPIYTEEVYDTDKVLGAKIHHSDNNVDIVLHNRTNGKIAAGGVTTTGEQAAIIGLMEDGYMEGFTVVAGTTLIFNNQTLMKSTSAATVSADFRGKAQYFVDTQKDQSIYFYAPYEVVGATVDGKSVNYSVEGNVAKVAVPAGTHTVKLLVKDAVEYLYGDEAGFGKAIYNENGELTYKYWDGEDGTEYLFEDGQVKINAYYDAKTKVLIREELLEDGAWQITTYDIVGNISKIEIQHTNGNLTTITYQADGSISTLITDKHGEFLEMTMDYKDGSKTVAQYLADKTITTKYDANGNVVSVTTMHSDGRREEATYDANGKLLSVIIRLKGGDREETIYNADGTVVTSIYTANKLTSKKTVNANGTAVLEEYLENGSVRVTKYDKDGNVIEVTIDGVLVEEAKDNNLWIIIVIAAVAVVGVAALVIVLVKIKKRNAKEIAE